MPPPAPGMCRSRQCAVRRCSPATWGAPSRSPSARAPPASPPDPADAADWAFARYPAEAEPANPYAEEDARYRLPPVRVAGIPLPPIHRAAFWLPSSEDAPVLLTLAVSAGAVSTSASNVSGWPGLNSRHP